MVGFHYVMPAPLMSPEITPKIEERFWSKVDKTPGQGPNGDCWHWTGAFPKPVWWSKEKRPYPCGFGLAGKSYRPSHIALAIVGKPRPSGEMQALHQCDNPPCVRPDHLRWGTMEENQQEARERPKRWLRVLTEDDVRAIRASSERHCDLAKQYGVTSPAIIAVRNRTTHKHLP